MTMKFVVLWTILIYKVMSNTYTPLKNWTNNDIPSTLHESVFIENDQKILAILKDRIQIWKRFDYQLQKEKILDAIVSYHYFSSEYFFVFTKDGKMMWLETDLSQKFSTRYEVSGGYATYLAFVALNKFALVGTSASGSRPKIYYYQISSTKFTKYDELQTHYSQGATVTYIISDKNYYVVLFSPYIQESPLGASLEVYEQPVDSFVVEETNMSLYDSGNFTQYNFLAYFLETSEIARAFGFNQTKSLVSMEFSHFQPNQLQIFVNNGFFAYSLINGLAVEYNATFGIDFSISNMVEEAVYFFGMKNGEVFTWDSFYNRIFDYYYFEDQVIVNVEYSKDADFMLVGTEQAMFLLTVRGFLFVHTIVSAGFILVSFLCILGVFCLADRKASLLLQDLNKFKIKKLVKGSTESSESGKGIYIGM